MARRFALPLVAGITGLALLTACGSTVQQTDARVLTDQGLDASGLGDGDPATSDPATDLTQGLAAGIPGGQGSGSGDGSLPGSTETSGSESLPTYSPTATQPAGVVAAETGRGFTKTTVQIGIADIDVGSYANTLGLKGVSPGDEKAQVTAVIGEMNKHGGLLGRKIQVVWYSASTAKTLNNPAQVSEEACATWTQDNHVYAVVGPIGITAERDLIACLTKAHTPLIGAGNPWGLDTQPYFQEIYDAYPNFVNIDSMLGETLYRVTIDRLFARRFFEPWDTTNGGPATGTVKPPVKIGVVIRDNPTGKLVLAAMTRELKRHGLSITDVATLPTNIAEQSSAGQNAVLRFHTDGITHELGNIALAFAEGQKYRPRYYIPNEPQLIAANAPAKQMVGAMAESYIPALDVLEPGPITSATTRCFALMRAARQDTSSGAAQFTMSSVCDGFFFLQAAVNAVGSLTDLTAGFESLGTRLPAALTFGTKLGPGRHASAVSLRDAAWTPSCSCFAYTDHRNHS